MALTRVIARPLLASVFFVGAANAWKNADALGAKASRVTDAVVPRLRAAGVPLPQDEAGLVRLNAATQVVAAAGLATGVAPRLSALVLGASLVPTTIAGHAFWTETDPASRQQHRLQLAKNLSVLGGLILAATDTEGRPGLVWRARHGLHDAAGAGRHLAREKALEARLAAARLS